MDANEYQVSNIYSVCVVLTTDCTCILLDYTLKMRSTDEKATCKKYDKANKYVIAKNESPLLLSLIYNAKLES